MAYKHGSCKECVKASVCKFRETREYVLRDIEALKSNDKYKDSCFMIFAECKEFLSNKSIWTSRNYEQVSCFFNSASNTSPIIEK